MTNGSERSPAPCAVLAAAGIVALFALVALGAGVGRYHVLAVPTRAPDVKVARDAAVVVVPVQRIQLRENDVIVAQFKHDNGPTLYRITGVDSWTREIFGINQAGKLVKFKLPGQVMRVSRVVPYVGPVYRNLAGNAQGIVLLFVAVMLLVRATLQRRAATPDSSRRRVGFRPQVGGGGRASLRQLRSSSARWR